MHQGSNSGYQSNDGGASSPLISGVNITTPFSAAVDPLRKDFSNSSPSNEQPQQSQQQQGGFQININNTNNKEPEKQQHPQNTFGEAEPAIALLLYSTCSVSMILLNKLVMDTFKIDFPLGLLFLQNAAALILVVLAKQMRWVHYPNFDTKVAQKWLPLTVFFVLMLWTSMKSLRTMSVAAQTILKNLAIILTAVGDWFFFKKHLTVAMFGAFGLMIFGSWLGSASDPWVTPEGVFWTFANIFCTVSYVLYMKNLLSAVMNEIGKYGPVFYNNLLSLPFLMLPSLPSLPDLAQAISVAPATAKLCLLLMVFVGAIMTFGTFWAMRVTSPTTYAVTGALNKVPLAFLGIIIFHHYPQPMGYVGICFALSAGILYAWVTRPQPKPLPRESDQRTV